MKKVYIFPWLQDAKNPINNVQMYATKFVVYAKFLEAVQSSLINICEYIGTGIQFTYK